MFYTIYEYDIKTRDIQIILEGSFFNDIGFNFIADDGEIYSANPQSQAFTQKKQFL